MFKGTPYFQCNCASITIAVIIVIVSTFLLTGCKTNEKATTKTTATTEQLEDSEQVEGRGYVNFTRYPENKLNFPAKGDTLVCKANTSRRSMSFYICTIKFDDDYRYFLSDGGYYYYRKGEFDLDSRECISELRGYPGNWDPCPLTFRWVTVFLDGYDLLVTVKPNETGKKRHCEIIISDEDYGWIIECTQSRGPYKPKKSKKKKQ
ncbi:MAG: hypothetical protein K2G59_02110 [Muribaculaceae bacterium]|nr:hypothetical protein [Muribaculaceae bacterium]